jgi:CheY-like chemotaxis protein
MLQSSLPAEAAETQIARARRMEVVGQLTGGIVHDFNNILTVVCGTIEMLAEAVADRPDLAAIAELIDQAASRGADLTAHLLAFAHGQPSRPGDVDVNALLRDAARLLRPTLGEQIEIDLALAADIPHALVEPHQLMTAILNLAIDARDAMPQGGRLGFSTASGLPAGRDVSGAGAENDVVIAVVACGYGACADPPAWIFADLSVAANCIGPSSGHIERCGDAGPGVTVRIYLPATTGSAEPPAERTSYPCAESDEAILIVEDDVLLRSCVITQVQSLGYRTFAAGNAGEALTIIDSGEKIDLLFTDVIMPGALDGRQLAVEALHRRPSLRVLFTSGYAANALVHGGRAGAGIVLLAKPYRRAELAKMIRSALAA